MEKSKVKKIKKETLQEQLDFIYKDGSSIRFLENPYEETCIEAVREDGINIKYILKEKLTEKICIEAVKEYGMALAYIPENMRTKEMCIEAVKQDALSIVYLDEKMQTEDICIECVKSNGLLISEIFEENITEKICIEAVKENGNAIKSIENKSDKACLYAFLNRYDLLNIDYIKESIDKIKNKENDLKEIVFTLNIKKAKELFDENKYDLITVDIKSLDYLKDYILNKNSKNHFVLNDTIDMYLLSHIALSNNELIILDTGNIEDIHIKLADKIIYKQENILLFN